MYSGASLSNPIELKFSLMMLDPDLTEPELDLVRRAAANWAARHGWQTQARATEYGFALCLWHNGRSRAFLCSGLHTALEQGAFSRIRRRFVLI